MKGKGKRKRNWKFFKWGKGQEGIMLLEILLALALISMVLSGVYSFYLLGLRSYHEGSKNIDIQQNARICADKIDRELKWVRDYNILAGGSQINFYFFDDPRQYSFRVRSRDLEFVIGHTVTKVACNIESVRFSTRAPHLIKYTIEAGEGEKRYELSSSVNLRNGGK